MRIIIRRENPHPGAQLSLFEQHEGKRHQVIATNTPGTQIQFREAAHRTQARVEDRIRGAKNTGLAHLPSRDYAINQAWCTAVSLACDLLAWLRLLALTGELAKAEPKSMRYRLLHTAARLVRAQRRTHLKIPEIWPWATDLCHAFHHPRPTTTLTNTDPTRPPQQPTRPVEPAPTRHDSRAPHPTHHPKQDQQKWVSPRRPPDDQTHE